MIDRPNSVFTYPHKDPPLDIIPNINQHSKMMDAYDPYSQHGDKYPVIHMNEMEECSSLDCTMDEEAYGTTSTAAAEGSWAAVVDTTATFNSGGIEESSRSNLATRRGRFATLSRHINSSTPTKKCLFFTSVFVILSSIGLAGVGAGMMLKNAHGLGFSFLSSSGSHDVSNGNVNAVEQVERSSNEDDLIGRCFFVSVSFMSSTMYFHIFIHYMNAFMFNLLFVEQVTNRISPATVSQ